MSEQPTPSPPRRRRAVVATVLTLAALAVAVPASGALAGGDAGDPGGTGSAPSGGQQRTAPVQDRDNGRPGDCPGHHGGRGQSNQSDAASRSAV